MSTCGEMHDAWGLLRGRAVVGLLVAPLVALLTYAPVLTETRSYREIAGRIPFAEVEVDQVTRDGDAILISGSMVKRRCEFVSLSALVRRGTGWDRAWVDTGGEEAARPRGDRPPGHQAWGVWAVRPNPASPTPTAWRVFATHRCPEDQGLTQINLFAEGAWP